MEFAIDLLHIWNFSKYAQFPVEYQSYLNIKSMLKCMVKFAQKRKIIYVMEKRPWPKYEIQGDPNQNLLIQMGVTLQMCTLMLYTFISGLKVLSNSNQDCAYHQRWTCKLLLNFSKTNKCLVHFHIWNSKLQNVIKHWENEFHDIQSFLFLQ